MGADERPLPHVVTGLQAHPCKSVSRGGGCAPAKSVTADVSGGARPASRSACGHECARWNSSFHTQTVVALDEIFRNDRALPSIGSREFSPTIGIDRNDDPGAGVAAGAGQ